MYEVNWNWLGGFFDGEGNVSAKIKKTDSYNIGYEFSPCYRIGQTGEEGRKILKEIQYFLDLKGIKSNYKYEQETREEWADKHYISITANPEVKKFTSEISNYTRLKEPQIKIMEREILPLMDNKAHLNKNGFAEIVYWKEILDSFKGGNNRSKYNREFFKNKWGIEFTGLEGAGDYKMQKHQGGSVFDY